MQKFWTTLVWLWVHYSPWLVTAFLPSIIAGLMISPKTQKAAGKVQWVLDVLKKLIGFLSVATFKDEPGTFKLPFYAGALLVKKTEEPKVETKDPPATPPVAAGLILILALSLPQSGCCKLFGVCGDGPGQDIIDCTTQAAMTNAPQLLPIIKDILTGQGDGWSKKIWDLIKEFGRDAVACAMQQVGQDLLMSVPPSGQAATPEQAAALEGVKRSRQFTADQKWQFKPSEK